MLYYHEEYNKRYKSAASTRKQGYKQVQKYDYTTNNRSKFISEKQEF